MEYLKGGLFDKDSMQTKVKTNRITGRERFWGHVMGPGLVYAFYCVVLGLRELYYMDIIRINEVSSVCSIRLSCKRISRAVRGS